MSILSLFFQSWTPILALAQQVVEPPQIHTTGLTAVEWVAIVALLGILLAIIGYFIKRDMRSNDHDKQGLKSCIDGLHTSVDGLKDAVSSLREEMLDRFVTKEDHRREVDRLSRSIGGAPGFARRRTDFCTAPGCPMDSEDSARATHPGGRLPLPGGYRD